MKNKKIFSFPYLLLSFLVLGPLLWFSLVYAQSQTQSGSISIDTAGLTSTATITIKVNGTDNTDPNNPISLSKNLTLTINPAPVSAPLTAPAIYLDPPLYGYAAGAGYCQGSYRLMPGE